MLAIAFLVAGLGFASTPLSAFAQDNFGLYNAFTAGGVNPPSTDQGFVAVMAGNLLRTFLGLVGLVALVAVIYGGFTRMSARGNNEEVAKGNRIVQYAVIGLVVAASAYAAVSFVERQIRERVRGSSWTGQELHGCYCSGVCTDGLTQQDCTGTTSNPTGCQVIVRGCQGL